MIDNIELENINALVAPLLPLGSSIGGIHTHKNEISLVLDREFKISQMQNSDDISSDAKDVSRRALDKLENAIGDAFGLRLEGKMDGFSEGQGGFASKVPFTEHVDIMTRASRFADGFVTKINIRGPKNVAKFLDEVQIV